LEHGDTRSKRGSGGATALAGAGPRAFETASSATMLDAPMMTRRALMRPAVSMSENQRTVPPVERADCSVE
jgi:hypothetical protein